MRLTILIPTRNRCNDLKVTLLTFSQYIEDAGHQEEVELVCLNNFSRDGTEEVCRQFGVGRPYFRYEHHRVERRSAETSSLYGLEFARGEYVWLFGDDDTPLPGGIERLLQVIDETNPGLILQNLLFDRPGLQSEYMTSTSNVMVFDRGIEFFRIFGMVTAVTTLSCLCFRKADFNVEHFERLAQASELYSHTFSLLVSFYKSRVVFIPPANLMYVPTHEEIEFQRMGGHSITTGRSPYYGFGHGLVRLINVAADMTGLSHAEIASFREIIIDKTPYLVRHTTLISFITRTFLLQLRYDPKEYRLSAEEQLELGAFIRRFDDPGMILCWEALISLQVAFSYANFATLVSLIGSYTNDFDYSRLWKAPTRGGEGDRLATLSFQEGVAPLTFYCRPSPLGEIDVGLNIFILVRSISSLGEFLEDVRGSGLLAELPATWTLLLDPRDRAFTSLAEGVERLREEYSEITLAQTLLSAEGRAPGRLALAEVEGTHVLFCDSFARLQAPTLLAVFTMIRDRAPSALLLEAAREIDGEACVCMPDFRGVQHSSFGDRQTYWDEVRASDFVDRDLTTHPTVLSKIAFSNSSVSLIRNGLTLEIKDQVYDLILRSNLPAWFQLSTPCISATRAIATQLEAEDASQDLCNILAVAQSTIEYEGQRLPFSLTQRLFDLYPQLDFTLRSPTSAAQVEAVLFLIVTAAMLRTWLRVSEGRLRSISGELRRLMTNLKDPAAAAAANILNFAGIDAPELVQPPSRRMLQIVGGSLSLPSAAGDVTSLARAVIAEAFRDTRHGTLPAGQASIEAMVVENGFRLTSTALLQGRLLRVAESFSMPRETADPSLGGRLERALVVAPPTSMAAAGEPVEFYSRDVIMLGDSGEEGRAYVCAVRPYEPGVGSTGNARRLFVPEEWIEASLTFGTSIPTSGFSGVEEWGVWMVGGEARFSVPVARAPDGAYMLELEMAHVHRGSRGALELDIRIGHDRLRRFSPNPGDTLSLCAWTGAAPAFLEVSLRARNYAEGGASTEDPRRLAVGISRLRVRRVRRGDHFIPATYLEKTSRL